MAGTIVEPPRQTMARSLWIHPRRPVLRQRRDKERRPGGQEDRQTDGEERVGEGEIRGGTSPAGALAHKGDTIRVGLKDGGWILFIFFLPCHPDSVGILGRGGRMGGWMGGGKGSMRVARLRANLQREVVKVRGVTACHFRRP